MSLRLTSPVALSTDHSTKVGLLRRALKDITLADGTYLPRGTLFAFAGQATHSDSRNYDRSEQFEPFRFSDLREAGESARHQFVNTSSEYMPFGRGKHAWYVVSHA